MAFRWLENVIPEGFWDPRLKVIWVLVKDFLALWQPENEFPAGLENAITDGLKDAWRQGTWLREKEC